MLTVYIWSIRKTYPSIKLNACTKPTVTSIVEDFLVQKATALATQITNPTAAQTKVGKPVSDLKSNSGTILTVAQLPKFTTLKLASATNVLSQLFYQGFTI